MLLLLLLPATGWGFGAPLTLCLEENSAPFSSPNGGIDNDIGQLLADELGRPLQIVWFQSEDGDEGSSANQINALLSSGLCELVGGFPLATDSLTPSPAKTYPLELPDQGRKLIRLKGIDHSLPYFSVSYALILGRGQQGLEINSLDNLTSLRVIAEQNSIADLLLMAHRGGMLRTKIIHSNPRTENLLDLLAASHGEAAWIERHRFEAWKQQHPKTDLTDSGYSHELKVNLGFALRADMIFLRDRVNEALSDLMDDAEIEKIVTSKGFSYQPPEEPLVLPPISQRLFAVGE